MTIAIFSLCVVAGYIVSRPILAMYNRFIVVKAFNL